MHPLKGQACDWLYRLLGLCFIQEHLGETESSPELEKEVSRLKGIAIGQLRELCKSAERSEELKDDEMFRMFGRVFGEDAEPMDVEKARKLLESRGYKVEKGR